MAIYGGLIEPDPFDRFGEYGEFNSLANFLDVSNNLDGIWSQVLIDNLKRVIYKYLEFPEVKQEVRTTMQNNPEFLN